MKTSRVGSLVLCALLGAGLGFAGAAMANGAVDGDTPAMMVSPSTIVLAKISTLTVHTNVCAADVDPSSVDLNGVAPSGLGVDNRGHLVGKFPVVDLCLEPGEAVLTLTCLLDDGSVFSASDTVTVK